MSILRVDKIAGLESVNAITGSVKFSSGNGANQGTYLEVYDPDRDFNLGTADFSIEFWMYPNTTDTSTQENDLASLFDYGYDTSGNTQGAWFAVHQDDRTLHFGFNNANQVQTSNFLNANTWHHIAIQKHGGFTRIYGDGTQVASVADTQDYTDSQFRTLQIGSQAATGVERSFDGYISCVRICKGHVIYKKAFTPPTRQLTVHDGPSDNKTVLFCCHSSQDPLREETGKDIVIGTKSGTPGPVATTFTPDVGNDHTHGTVLEGGTAFNSLNYLTLPRGTTTQSNRGRALIAGGTNGGGWGTKQNTISYIQIQSGGIVKDFGDLSSLRSNVSSVSSSTRAVFGGGSEGASANNAVNTIEYVTIATSSNVTNFGDLTSLRNPRGGVSNNTRGLFGGGYISPAGKAEVDHVTIATTGDATDFGDLSVSGEPNEGSSNSTRGVWMGGGWGAQIEYVTIASTGSGADFGNVGNNRVNAAGASSSTRALLAGGGTAENAITYITIATLGNDTDFGDLTVGRRTQHGTSNGLRGIFCGGYTPDYNIIDYVDIATTGNAKDFGDLTTALREPDACSDSHGGLS